MCKFIYVALNKNIAETRDVGYLKYACKNLLKSDHNSGERSRHPIVTLPRVACQPKLRSPK
jgi:hypothetical protein